MIPMSSWGSCSSIDISLAVKMNIAIDKSSSIAVPQDIYVSQNIHAAALIFDESKPVCITFPNATNPRVGNGAALATKYRFNSIWITCRRDDWFQYHDLEDAEKAIAAFVAKFPKRVLMGTSMGAYGALLCSKALKADYVIAYSAQTSIGPQAPAKDSRYQDRWSRIAQNYGFPNDHMTDRLTHDGEVIVLYDPLHLDRTHIPLLESIRPITKFPFHCSGHGTMQAMVNLGLASSLLSSVMDGSYDATQFRRLIRAKRQGPLRDELLMVTLQQHRKPLPQALVRRYLEQTKSISVPRMRMIAGVTAKSGWADLLADSLLKLLSSPAYCRSRAFLTDIQNYAACLAASPFGEPVLAKLMALLSPGSTEVEKATETLCRAEMRLTGRDAANGMLGVEASLNVPRLGISGAIRQLELAAQPDTAFTADDAVQALASLLIQTLPGSSIEPLTVEQSEFVFLLGRKEETLRVTFEDDPDVDKQEDAPAKLTPNAELSPHFSLRLAAARLLYASHQPEAATALVMEAASRLSPWDSDNLMVAQWLIDGQQPALAEPLIARAAKLVDMDWVAIDQVARLLEKRSEWAAATELWERAARHGVEPEKVTFRLASLLMRQRQPAQALEKLSPLLSQAHPALDVLKLQGSLLLQLARHAEAIPVFSQVLAQQPKDASVHRSLATCYHAVGELTHAMALAQEAERLVPMEANRKLIAALNKALSSAGAH